MRKIRQTYETVTPESAEDGEADDRGWIDEDGSEIAPDDFDIDEYGSESAAAIALAVRRLQDAGALEPSSSVWYRGTWYSTIDPDRDYSTGGETRYSFFLDGFSDDECKAIHRELTWRKTF